MREVNHCGEYAVKAKEKGLYNEFIASEIMAQTEKAFLLRDGKQKAWFPKSVVCVHTYSKGRVRVEYPEWVEPKWEVLEERDIR